MSNNPYRTMCADMLEAFDGLPCETSYKGQSRPIVCIDEEPFDRARALLAQPEPEGLTDAAAWDLADDLGIIRGHSGDLHVSFADLGPFARAALARFDHPTPQPPAYGEVGVLVERLKELAHATTKENWREFDMRLPAEPLRDADLVLTRAADLLHRQRPQPVAVSERLPGAKDCDAEWRCWLLYRSASMKMTPVWSLVHRRCILDAPYTHWLPANALPTPTPEAQP